METKYLFSFLIRQNKRRGITYSEFTKAVGIHVSTISNLLNGTIKPTDTQRKKIAEYFGFDNIDTIIFARDNSLTVREVSRQKDKEIKTLQDKCKVLEDELTEANKLIEKYKTLVNKTIKYLNKLTGGN